MRTLQQQLQDLADWCAGLAIPDGSREEQFPHPALRSGWFAVAEMKEVDDIPGFRERLLAMARPAMIGYDDGLRLYERMTRVIPSDKRPFRSLAEIAADLPPLKWLWKSWLASGKLNMLVAPPGAGKSMVALELAGRVMRGHPWPDYTDSEFAPSKVIYVDGENIPEVHNARAEAWGLPTDNLFMLLPDEEDGLVDLGTTKYQELLIQMVFRLKPALVIVDSLGAVMSKGENAVEDVRKVLGFLAMLAQQYEVAVLAIHHLRKGPAGQSGAPDLIDQDQIRGSTHIVATFRSVIGLSQVQTGPKPDANSPRKLHIIKSNLAAHPEPLGVDFEPVKWTEHVCPVYSMKAPEPYVEPAARTAAQEWLLNYLADAGKPVSSGEVVAAAKVEGFSRASLYRARAVLEGEIVSTGVSKALGACWLLAGQAPDCLTVSLSQAPQPVLPEQTV